LIPSKLALGFVVFKERKIIIKLNPKQKFYFSIVIVFVILALIVFAVIFPLIGKIRTSANNYLEGKKTLLVLEANIKDVKSLEKKYQEVKDTFAKLETAFLDPAETLGFITSLEKLAEETGNSFAIEKVNIASEGKFINFQVSLSGDFSSLVNFLIGLENTPYPPYRLVGVENIDIRKISDVNVGANFNVAVYTK